jgi:hypothetical protein
LAKLITKWRLQRNVLERERGYLMPANLKEIPFMPSTLETIDYAIYNWLNDELDLHTTTQDGFEKVPVIWAAAERAFQVKRDKDLRDQDGTLILPLITIERTSVVKDLSRKGTAWANIPPVNDEKGRSITIARRIKQDKTANLQMLILGEIYSFGG